MAEDPLARRLDGVEARLVALGARLEQMEASLDQVIRDEGHTVSTEIRYTLSELGRRLALDLPQTLERHRQMIVAELRPGGAGEVEVKPAAAATGTAGSGDGEPKVEAEADGTTAVGVTDEADDADEETDDVGPASLDPAGVGPAGVGPAGGDVASESSNDGARRKRRRRRGEG